jgi:hypothetical protein
MCLSIFLCVPCAPDDVCEKIVDKGAFGVLLEVATKQVGGGESSSLKATQALSVRTISYLAVNGRVRRRATIALGGHCV